MRVLNRTFLAIVSALTLSAFSSAVSANCAVDLRGVWTFYTLGSTIQYSNCTFTMDRDGNLEPGSECQVYNQTGLEFDPETEVNIPVFESLFGVVPATGRYVVGDDCSVSGNITLLAATLTLVDAKINNSRDAVSGIQYDTFGTRLNEFTMFRVD